MNCTRCGRPVDPSGRFCMHCGTPLPAAASASSTPTDARTMLPGAFEAVQAKQRRAMRWLVVVGIVGAFVAALVGLQMAGVLGVGAEQEPAPVLQASGAVAEPPLLRAEGSTAPPVLERPGERIVMPKEIRDWLEHLRRTEERRMRLAEDQINQALPFAAAGMAGLSGIEALFGDLDDPPVTVPEELNRETRDGVMQGIRRDWNALTEFFNSVPPPAECIEIRNRYDQPLRETGNLTADLLDAITSPDTQGALARVGDVKRRNRDLIDRPALETDELVAEICRKYNTRKWFDIKGDVGSGSLGKNLF